MIYALGVYVVFTCGAVAVSNSRLFLISNLQQLFRQKAHNKPKRSIINGGAAVLLDVRECGYPLIWLVVAEFVRISWGPSHYYNDKSASDDKSTAAATVGFAETISVEAGSTLGAPSALL